MESNLYRKQNKNDFITNENLSFDFGVFNGLLNYFASLCIFSTFLSYVSIPQIE